MKKTLLKSLALAAVGSLFVVGSAMAVPYTATLNDLAGWTQLSTTGDSASTTVADGRPFALNVDFTTTFDKFDSSGHSYTGYATATIGRIGNFDLSGSNFTTFDLSFNNHNENPWDYTLWMADNAHTASTAFTLANGSITSASLDISQLNLANITSYGFTVGAMLPNGAGTTSYPDMVAQNKLAPVPEPATMLLLGTGLAGIAGLRRKKVKKA